MEGAQVAVGARGVEPTGLIVFAKEFACALVGGPHGPGEGAVLGVLQRCGKVGGQGEAQLLQEAAGADLLGGHRFGDGLPGPGVDDRDAVFCVDEEVQAQGCGVVAVFPWKAGRACVGWSAGRTVRELEVQLYVEFGQAAHGFGEV
ncbi:MULTISPECIES: hypothetical protein [Streptomyces]|uniref:Uncharacterized protein n=1 Tax=Streptomyces kasugaensis TaxID=1946 RepID=A0A4Q9HV35_STRKA|nr:hypothetical protein [Streptomyces kasugaensis]TBO58080.1 hypothetical protein EYS09_19280 [Streptomyces kasugaensis]